MGCSASPLRSATPGLPGPASPELPSSASSSPASLAVGFFELPCSKMEALKSSSQVKDASCSRKRTFSGSLTASAGLDADEESAAAPRPCSGSCISASSRLSDTRLSVVACTPKRERREHIGQVQLVAHQPDGHEGDKGHRGRRREVQRLVVRSQAVPLPHELDFCRPQVPDAVLEGALPRLHLHEPRALHRLRGELDPGIGRGGRATSHLGEELAEDRLQRHEQQHQREARGEGRPDERDANAQNGHGFQWPHRHPGQEDAQHLEALDVVGRQVADAAGVHHAERAEGQPQALPEQQGDGRLPHLHASPPSDPVIRVMRPVHREPFRHPLH
eukprot:scaffold1140_cov251-Pinguiococcus_pyrenoidosus.AAC.11